MSEAPAVIRSADTGTSIGSADPTFRTIDELAERCGHYCWIEYRLFALTGRLASAPRSDANVASHTESAADAVSGAHDSEIRVLLSEMASHHAFLAGQWRDRLPVRAGIDPDALVVPPPGPVEVALDLLGAEPEARVVLSGLVVQLLPRLLAAYEDDAAHASAVSEAPVLGLLELAHFRLTQEIRDGRILLGRGSGEGSGRGSGSKKVADFGSALQQVLGVGIDIVPAARAS